MRTSRDPFALLYRDAGWVARQDRRRKENVAQGPLSGLAALPPPRAVGGAAGMLAETAFGVGPNPKQIFL